MKILVISHTYIAPINREKWRVLSQRYSDVQIKIVIPKKWPATMFNIEAGDLSSYNSKNCEFIALDTFKTGNEVLYGYKFFDLIKILKKFKPDIVHVEQGDNAFSYFQSILLSKLFCRKTKFTFFTWINWTIKKSWKYKLIWNFIEKFNLYFSHGAIVGNNDAKQVLQDKKFQKPIEVLLQLGVTENFFKPVLRIKEYKKTFKIGYVGRIIKEKGLFILIDAFVQISEKFPNWILVLVGNGKDKKELVNYVLKKKLKDKVVFKDAVSHEEIGNILNDLDVFVLPSYDTSDWKEQFGHVLIEAMSCKTSIIGSSAGAIPFVIKDVGLIFEQKNVISLKNCLEKLMLDENLRNELGQKGYKKYKKNYSYEFIADKIYAFWCKITHNNYPECPPKL